MASLLGAIEQVVAETPMSRIPEGVKVRIELTSNGGRYFIYRYTDKLTKKRKAIYGGPSRTLDPERIALYEKRRKKQA